MTDNYQIDKNSKLFQKFLNLKNNKPPEPTPDRPSQQNHNLSTKNSTNTPSSDPPLPRHNDKAPLHVTIGDIEEAA